MKILVTGNAGSGKSTVAAQIAKRTGIRVVCLDSVVWKLGWIKTPFQERKAEEIKIANQAEWIVDGVSSVIQTKADLVVFLDIPRWKSYLRCARRNRKYLFDSRPGLPRHCPELLIVPELVKLIWNFPLKVRPNILALAKRHAESQTFVHIRNRQEIDRLLSNLAAQQSDQHLERPKSDKLFL